MNKTVDTPHAKHPSAPTGPADGQQSLPTRLLKRVENRPTEDDLAQAALGGPKGSPDLPPAPLTRQEKQQMLPNDDPGHVA